MSLFEPLFTSEAMAAALSGSTWLEAILRFESALATVEERYGLIPSGAAGAIGAACSAGGFDVAVLGAAGVASASPVLPVVEALRLRVGPPHSAHVHLGATSQDALDTALMLVARGALDVLVADVDALAERCAELVTEHRATPMLGRTLLQPARAITFGCKAANWLAAVLSARRRLLQTVADELAVQLGGPVGTLDAFGDRGPEVRAALARELGLRDPEVAWHTDRARVRAVAAAAITAAAPAAKIATDVILLSQGEVGEVAEGEPGRSSSMPHKRNPARSIEARAAWSAAAGHAAAIMAAAPAEHERAAGSWQAEWPALVGALSGAGAAVHRAGEALSLLQVDPARMAANLAAAGLADDTAGLGAATALADRVLASYERGIR